MMNDILARCVEDVILQAIEEFVEKRVEPDTTPLEKFKLYEIAANTMVRRNLENSYGQHVEAFVGGFLANKIDVLGIADEKQ